MGLLNPQPNKEIKPNLLTLASSPTLTKVPNPLGNIEQAKTTGFNFAKSVAKDTARATIDLAEILPRTVDSLKGTGYFAKPNPIKTPLGTIESFSSEASKRVKEGESPTKAAVETAGNVAINEPFGLAFKPLALGLGLLGKGAGDLFKGGEEANKLSKTKFTSPKIRDLNPIETLHANEASQVIGGKKDQGVIGKVPSTFAVDGKERPLILSKEVVSKIQKDHGNIGLENLVINANDWDVGLKNILDTHTNIRNPDKINLIKKVPGSNNYLLIGADRKNGFFTVTHFETVDAEDLNKLKSLLGRGEQISPSGNPLWAPEEFLNAPPALGSTDGGVLGRGDNGSIPLPSNKTQGDKGGLLRERGFVQSARELTPENTKIAGQYVPRDTDELSIKAKNLIKENPTLAENIALTRADDHAVAIGSELMKKLSKEAEIADGVVRTALFDRQAKIANTLAVKLTESGRTIQAASLLGRLSPEGQIRFAAREIQRYNELNPGKAIPELSGEQAKYIQEEMMAIRNMADGMDRAEKFQKLQDYIKQLVPTPLIKKIVAVWKAGLLTGIKTTGLNLFSNLSHSATEIAKDVPAAIADSVMSLFSGKRTKTFNIKGTLPGLKIGFDKGLLYLKTGFDERNIAQKLDYNKVNFGKGLAAKAFQTYTDTVFRVVASGDQPFYYGAVARSLGDQALAQGMNKGLKGKELKEFADTLVQNPTEEMLRYATADASTAVFMNETYLGKAAKAVQKIPIVGEIVVPFAHTPSAVATQIVNYTPIGTVAEIGKQIARGQFDQRLLAEAMGRGLTGTGVLYLGWQLAKNGMVSLDRPTTEREQKLWELEGRKPNSILIDGKWRSPTVLGPVGNLLLIGGHFNRAFKESGSPTEALAKAVTGSAKSFSEQTFLTGINSAIGALNDPGRYAENYLGQMVGSLVPTLVSDVARATDSKERRTESVGDKLKARIPGLRNNLEPQVDVLGKERERVGNPLEVMIDPTRPQPALNSPVTSELRRLWGKGQKVSPTLLGDKKGYPVLSPQDNTELWKRAGEITNGKLGNLFKREDYKKLDDEEKGKVVDKVVDKSKVVARAEMVLKVTQGIVGEKPLKDKLSQLKKGGLLTNDVFKVYMELR